MNSRLRYVLTLPERLIRFVAAAGGGAVHETAELVLPRLVRRSRLYEATAKNLLRITVELVGGVERPHEATADEFEPSSTKLAVRKGAGNVVELGSILAFGLSPLWLLAGAADVTRGTRIYLDALVSELKAAGVIAKDAELESVDDLLSALEGASGTSARLIDLPPLEVQGLRQSLTDLRSDAGSLPSPGELAAVYDALVRESEREKKSLLEVSLGMGIAFFNSARKVGRQHLLDPYTEDLSPVRDEGFGTYARRVGKPYADAVVRHFSPSEKTLVERGVERLGRSKLLESRGMAHPDSFGARARLAVGEREVELFRLDALQERFDVLRLPYTLRILLENVLRNENGVTVTAADVEAVAGWVAAAEPSQAISFTPGRVLHQDFTGVPAIVDLAAMRNAMADLGGEAARINPLLPSELVIDHSVQVDEFATPFAIRRNSELEFERNRERYAFLRWGQSGFVNFKVVPPATGIVHQVNLEFLARVVDEREGTAFPDTLLGTDSHTTMINGLGVLGWGVGGIEAEAAMLGEAVSMLVPQVVGFKLMGAAAGGRDRDRPRPDRHPDPARDGRGRKVRRVLRARARRPAARGSGDDREHVARVRRDLRVLPRGRGDAPLPPAHRPLRGAHRARRGVLQGERALARPRRRADVHAGRRARPLDGRAVAGWPEAAAGPSAAARREAGVPRGSAELRRGLRERARRGGCGERSRRAIRSPPPRRGTRPTEGDAVVDVQPVALAEMPGGVEVTLDGQTFELEHGSVVIAAITSCTNTSNPAVMVGAGLLAKNAVERGLTRKPWVKSSLAPGSKVVTQYYDKAGLTPYLEQLGFHTVGYGCTTCIGNSGPLPDEISRAIVDGRPRRPARSSPGTGTSRRASIPR